MCVTCSKAETRKLRRVLNASLGFGGANACMIIGGPPDAKGTTRVVTNACTRENDCDPVITGVGVLLPTAIGNDAFVELATSGDVPSPESRCGTIPAEQYGHLINARRTRRMSDYAKLCLAATGEAYRDAGIDDAPDVRRILRRDRGHNPRPDRILRDLLPATARRGSQCRQSDALCRGCAQRSERSFEH